jgi:hypothetical protein
MQLFKKNTGVCIGEVKELKTLTERSRGLLGAESPYGVYFKTHWGIHTFGMKFPIDVIIADRNFRVRKIKKSLGEKKFFFWNPLWGNVFELPEGSVLKAELYESDSLELKI